VYSNAVSVFCMNVTARLHFIWCVEWRETISGHLCVDYHACCVLPFNAVSLNRTKKMPVFKVWDATRQLKKLVVAATLSEIIDKGLSLTYSLWFSGLVVSALGIRAR